MISTKPPETSGRNVVMGRQISRDSGNEETLEPKKKVVEEENEPDDEVGVE